jgi:hypothetical protein
VVLLIARPSTNVPVNDDWQYAHIAKVFAQTGRFRLDVPIAPAVIGQSIIALPVIRFFGFSHLGLRLLTIAFAVGLLFELNYLMRLAGASAKVRLVALCIVVVNPIFLHLATSFMTEIYGYTAAFLAACLWYRGKQHDSKYMTITAALTAGLSFWIRQFCVLILPALIVSEWLANPVSLKSTRLLLYRRSPEIFVSVGVVAAYFIWARLTGNAPAGAEGPGLKISHPDPLALVIQTGIWLFYITFFFLPFVVARVAARQSTVSSAIFVGAFAGTALLVSAFGQTHDAPQSGFNAVFPFLNNVLSKYLIGPVTLRDVYRGEVQVTPPLFRTLWLTVELVVILAAAGWPKIASCLRRERNDIALFGVGISVLSLFAVLLTYSSHVFDRYHFPAILGFALAMAACVPADRWSRVRNAAVLYIAVVGTFSSFALHDYFRWQESRAELLEDAQRAHVALSDIDAGYEPNGWNAVEGGASSPGCGPSVGWFCHHRRYRLGAHATAGETVLGSRHVDSWLIHFPDIKLLDAPKT